MGEIFSNNQSPGLGKEIHSTSALDLTIDTAVHLGRDASDAAWQDFASLACELRQNLRILVAHLFEWKVDTLPGHAAVCLTEGNPAFNSFRFGHRIGDSQHLPHLAMKSTASKKRIVFDFLQTPRGPEAFLIAGRIVTRGRTTFRFRFGALKDDDIAWHDLD